MEKIYNIAISCIGSGVGQSVINSCRLSKLPIKTFGFGTNPFANGLYDCDEYVYTPTIYSENYVNTLLKICKDHKIDLIIPGMDDEAHIFSKEIEKFDAAGIKVIVAGEELLDICRDKEKMSDELNKITPIFVRSFDKEGFIDALKNKKIELPVIAKPRGGFASRGIEIINSEDDISKITDSHIVQELAVPHKADPNRKNYEEQLKKNNNAQISEISIQIVADQQGEIIGRMASYNKLNNGIPIEILPYQNEEIWAEVEKLYPTLKKLGLRGPFNLQGRLTDKGLKLFELNARFTGITGLRAYMGFNEVEACLKEWLNLDSGENKLTLNHGRFGIRQTADKAIDLSRNKEVKKLFDQVNNQPGKSVKTLLITGATGYLGRNLIDKLIVDEEPFLIWVLSRDKNRAKELLPPQVTCFDNDDLDNGVFSLGNVDILLHAGFARPHRSDEEIAESLTFTADLFRKAVTNQVANIINISSQSVYGQGSMPPWKEDSVLAPETPYGAAKYASELLLSNLSSQHKHINHTSIRLGGLTGGAKGFIPIDLIFKLVSRALKSENLKIIGGNQTVERLDVRDAVGGIKAILKSSSTNWKNVYNLGSSDPMQLIDLSKLVVDTVYEKKEIKSEIILEDKEVKQYFGLNSDRFYRDFQWKPKYSMKETIRTLIDFDSKNENL